MKHLLSISLILTFISTFGFAADSVSLGQKAFKKCTACHAIIGDNGEVLRKGGKAGPNLYGIIGRTAGSAEFRYSKALKAAGAASNGRDGDLARRQARHVIESLRQFQSACALTELYASGAEGSQNGLLDFCDALLRSVSGETSSELRDATLDLMSGVVAQLDAIPDGLVELLLVSLLPSGRKAAPTTHWLAQAVVRRGADALTRPVAAWLNGCLSLSPT